MDKPASVICKNCGAIDDYWTELKNGQQVAYCNGCDKYIKNIPYNLPKFYYGKMVGKLVSEVKDLGYLKWFLTGTTPPPKPHMKEAIEKRIKELETEQKSKLF